MQSVTFFLDVSQVQEEMSIIENHGNGESHHDSIESQSTVAVNDVDEDERMTSDDSLLLPLSKPTDRLLQLIF